MERKYMARALALAREGAAAGEVPVGCVIVRNGTIIGEGINRREGRATALGHAEIMAIDAACRHLSSWRLSDCTLYVTLEPCPMCAGAILNARVDTVVYGADDPSMGACGSVINLFEEAFGHKPKLYGGFLAAECSQIMTAFFRQLREPR